MGIDLHVVSLRPGMAWNRIEALEWNSVIPSNSATEPVCAYLPIHMYML